MQGMKLKDLGTGERIQGLGLGVEIPGLGYGSVCGAWVWEARLKVSVLEDIISMNSRRSVLLI